MVKNELFIKNPSLGEFGQHFGQTLYHGFHIVSRLTSATYGKLLKTLLKRMSKNIQIMGK